MMAVKRGEKLEKGRKLYNKLNLNERRSLVKLAFDIDDEELKGFEVGRDMLSWGSFNIVNRNKLCETILNK